MTNKLAKLILLGVLTLTLTACNSPSNDVASLAATPTPAAADAVLDNESLMLEFAECLRNEGLEITDPTVDSDGNIQKPELVEGATASKEEWIAAYEVCGEIIENITFEEKEVDRSAQLDQYTELAACMSEAGYDIGEPTAETLDTWMNDFKNTIDWEDPDAMEAFDTCMGGSSGSNDGKGK
ncbi:MAG: hypothetical protein GY796_05390 [Chloroflexi bacterium]|nr:hypothetical protein [Chloroflexota bacterium]